MSILGAIKCFFLCALLVTLSLAVSCAPAGTPTTVLLGAKLVDSVSGPIDDSVIVIEGSRILDVGTKETTLWPTRARIIDLTGKYVIPGLADMHNHLGEGSFDFNEGPVNYRDNLARMLAWGFTIVFNPGVPNLDISRDLRSAAKAEAGRYPHYYGTGVRFAAPQGHGSATGGAYTPVTQEEARAAVRELKSVPVEAVKIVHDDLSYVTTSLRPKLKPEIIDAIVDEAHKQDLKVYAHAPILADAKELLRVGIDGLIHGVISDPVDDEFIELMLNKKAVYVATHAIFEAASDTVGWARREIDFDTRGWVPIEVLEFGTSRERVRQWEGRFDKLTTIKAKLPILRANVKKVFDAGVPVVVGSDTASVGSASGIVLGLGSQLELKLLEEAGLSPIQVLRAATINAAAMIGRSRDIGSVQRGKLADLVILDADPLTDIANIRSIYMVIKNGVVHDPVKLLEGLN